MAMHLARESKRHRYDHPSEAERYQMIPTYFRMLIEGELPGPHARARLFAATALSTGQGAPAGETAGVIQAVE